MGPSTPRDRAATTVEYALMVAVFVLAVLGGLQALERSAGEEFAGRRADIADTGPTGTIAGPTTTAATIAPPASSTTSTSSTSTTTAVTLPPSTTSTTVVPALDNPSCVDKTCSFSLVSPSPASTYRWYVDGTERGSGASFEHTAGNGDKGYTLKVIASPGGQTATLKIQCENGKGGDCSP